MHDEDDKLGRIAHDANNTLQRGMLWLHFRRHDFITCANGCTAERGVDAAGIGSVV